MAKPYIIWRPSLNRTLHVPRASGPFIMDDGTMLDQFEYMVRKSVTQTVFLDKHIDYLHSVSYSRGTDPQTGLRAQQVAYMPTNMTFYGADPSGEPEPMDDSDSPPLAAPFLSLGHRLVLRGWIATAENLFNSEMRVKWGDRDTRNASDAAGRWTGMGMTALNFADLSIMPAMDYGFGMKHGKRYSATNWGWNSQAWGPLGALSSMSSVQNGVDQGENRIVVTPSGPSQWTAYMQYMSGSWQNLDIVSGLDLRSEMSPPYLEYMALMGYLLAGQSRLGVPFLPDPAPDAEHWFREIEVSMFEPWVVDDSNWTARDWDEHWEWLTGSTFDYDIGRRKGPIDLLHIPMGLPGAPASLRSYDDDLGVCVEFDEYTWLRAFPQHDRAYMVFGGGENVSVCDEGSYGYQAPFAAAGLFKFESMTSWPADTVVFSFGDIHSASPAVANGLGVFWRPTGPSGAGELVLRAWDDNLLAWVDQTADFDAADWEGRPVSIALAWTGSRGSLIDHDAYELRLVVNGVTVASAVIPDMRLKGSQDGSLGAPTLISGGAYQSFRGKFGGMEVFADVIVDDELKVGFEDTEDLDNPSFETARADGRPGEAEAWEWFSFQQTVDWAEFNTYDPDLARWKTCREGFEGGWDNENWAADLSELTVVAVEFSQNIMELFGIWTFPDETPPSPGAYTGPPWREFTLRSPADDSLGFSSEWDASHLGGLNMYLPFDGFEEMWGNTMYEDWVTTALDGKIIGAALSFPLEIRPENNRLLIGARWDYTAATSGGLFGIVLAPGSYADMTALLSELNTKWLAQAGPAADMGFSSWSSGDAEGLTFGWNRTITAGVNFFQASMCALERDYNYDARAVLGLKGLGPGGVTAGVKSYASRWALYGAGLPVGIQNSDVVLQDIWTTFKASLLYTDAYVGNIFGEAWAQPAEFDTAVPATTVSERFGLDGWIAPGTPWYADIGDMSTVEAEFSYGGLVATIELFVDVNWPDELWT